MEYQFSSWMVFGAAAAIIFLSTILVVNRRKNNNNNNQKKKQSYRNGSSSIPPGSLGWPLLIGETIQFISCSNSVDHPDSFMEERRSRYGEVFKSHLFGRPTIVSTDAEVSRYVLQCDAQTFVTFLPKSVRELLGKSSILLTNGAIQRKLHGLIGAYFKSPELKAQITLHLQEFIQESMGSWKEDRPIHIQHETKRIAFQVLVKSLISLDPGEEMECIRQQFQEFIAGFATSGIKLPGSKFSKSLEAKKKMVKLLNKIIKEKRDRNINSTGVPELDAADMFLINASDQLTDEVISDNIIDLMVPGDDSIPVVVALAIRYLSDSPNALQEFTEENINFKRQKDHLGEPMKWSDYISLPFTQCVITETLRMGNIISGVMREARKDVEIKGHFIPKGWCVMTNFRSVHLDPNQYNSPHQFNPWRWQGKDSVISSINFTPFGGGQRLCPGADLARLEASIFLHHFVTRFSWVAQDDTVINFPTVSLRKGMPVLVKQRADYL